MGQFVGRLLRIGLVVGVLVTVVLAARGMARRTGPGRNSASAGSFDRWPAVPRAPAPPGD